MSNIEWTDATWNPVVGCTPVSPGCLNCYAATMAVRLEAMGQEPYVGLTVKGKQSRSHEVTKSREPKRAVFNGTVRMLSERLTEPFGWKRPRMVFVDSMSDLFHEDVPFEFIDRVFAVMALTPRHTYQVLTKRPERMAEYFNDFGRANIRVYDAATEIVNADFDRFPGDMASKRSSGGSWWPLPNVWLGTSVEDQARADERIPHLLRCPASVRFLSVEPLLGHVDLEFQPKACPSCGRGDFITTTRTKGADTICGCAGERCADAPLLPTIDWVIVGGESGAHARPCDVRWIESVVTQCKAAGVPVFVKQLGARVWAQDRPAPYSREEPHGRLIEAAPPDYLFSFKNRKGSDPEEWPSYLRVREWPVGFVPSSL